MNLMSQNIYDLLRGFLEYLEIEKGRSIKTIENYSRYLKCFFEFSKIKFPEEITDEIITSFRLWLNRRSGPKGEGGRRETIKKKTQNYYLIALRVFLKYLSRRGIKSLPPERIELAKISQRNLDLINEEELEALLASPDGQDIKSLRDKSILELLFSTGLRVSELCSLNRSHINSSRNGEFSVQGKGGKIRVVFMSDRANDSLKKYLEKRTDMDPALFARILIRASSSETSLRLTPRSIERIVKHRAIQAGISKKVTPHVVRHCFATDLLSGGADIRSVQSLLGHSNITTTQIYTHVTDKHLRDVHKLFHGKARKKII